MMNEWLKGKGFRKPSGRRGSGGQKLAQHMKGGIHPSPFPTFPSLVRKRYPFTVGLPERAFQSLVYPSRDSNP